MTKVLFFEAVGERIYNNNNLESLPYGGSIIIPKC